MDSLVADYGSDSESNSDSDSSDSSSTRKTPVKIPVESAAKKPTLPPPSFDDTSGSIFTNPYIEAENAKSAILEKHVKMIPSQEFITEINGKKICWMYRKGRCRFGSQCKYAHDSELYNQNQSNSEDTPDTGQSNSNETGLPSTNTSGHPPSNNQRFPPKKSSNVPPSNNQGLPPKKLSNSTPSNIQGFPPSNQSSFPPSGFSPFHPPPDSRYQPPGFPPFQTVDLQRNNLGFPPFQTGDPTSQRNNPGFPPFQTGGPTANAGFPPFQTSPGEFNPHKRNEEEGDVSQKRKKRPGLSQSIVPGKKVMKMYYSSNSSK